MYTEGSMLFTIGGAASMSNITKENESLEKVLVVTPYFIGGVCFTVGAYAGVLEVINIHNKDGGITDWFFTGPTQWRKMRKYLGWEPLLGYISYFLGTIFFGFNVTAGYLPLTTKEYEWWGWFPAVLGSICFAAGGALECYHNKVWECKLGNPTWWISILNGIGGFGFLFAASCGFFKADNV